MQIMDFFMQIGHFPVNLFDLPVKLQYNQPY